MSYDSRDDTLKHIETVKGLLNTVKQELWRRAVIHDASKLIDPEKEIFDEYTPKLKDSTYGSQEYNDFLIGMGEALEHHYEENRHHPEHFENGIRDMNLIDIIEMFCDWKAATLRHADGDIRKSIIHNKERFGYSDELEAIFNNTVDFLENKK